MVLGAGRGTRLAPLTNAMPKILVPFAGRPLLAFQLEYLARNGVSEVVVNAHHLAEDVERFVATAPLPLPVRVSRERVLLGTAGALLPLQELLSETFVLFYGDVVTDAGLAPLVARHRDSGAAGTISYYRAADVEGKGVIDLGRDGRVRAFREKPNGHRGPGCVNAGLYVLEPGILDHVGGPPSDFGHDVWPRVLARGEHVVGVELDAYLRDIGDAAALAAAERDFALGRLRW